MRMCGSMLISLHLSSFYLFVNTDINQYIPFYAVFNTVIMEKLIKI